MNGKNLLSITFADEQLALLKQETIRSQRKAFAEGTFDNHLCQWVTYLEFCVFFQLVAFPANALVVAWYAQFLTRRLKSHGALLSYISGVKKLHQMLGYSIKSFKHFILKITLMGLKRSNEHVVVQAPPITPKLLEQMHAQLNFTLEEDVVFWAAAILAFFLLFRKSNLLPDTKWGFDKAKQLRRKDLLFTKDKVIVGIRWAKNHQFTRELFTFPLPKIPNSSLCPVSALHVLFRKVRGDANSHLFSFSDGSSLTYKKFQEKTRRVLAAAGVPRSDTYRSHSYRRGGTTFSFLCGIPTPIIKTLGMWRSDSYLRYIDFPLEARTAASELMKYRIMQQQHHFTLNGNSHSA